MRLYNTISWGGMQIEYASIADFRTFFYIYIYIYLYLHTYTEINKCMYIYICKYAYIHGFKVKVKLYNTISWGGMQIEYAR